MTVGEKGTERDIDKQDIFRFQKAKFNLVRIAETDFDIFLVRTKHTIHPRLMGTSLVLRLFGHEPNY